jgi:hypothetical protein
MRFASRSARCFERRRRVLGEFGYTGLTDASFSVSITWLATTSGVTPSISYWPPLPQEISYC